MPSLIQLNGVDGGGQILRTALSLSMITGRGFRIVNIRGKRKKGGLKRQHLTCVRAAVAVSGGSVDGAELDSRELVFQPGSVQAGAYKFAIGTAGSTTLLAQTLLPALWFASGSSTLHLEGGTHNPMAPSADFINRVFLPQLAKMGAVAELNVVRHGFVPAGGGLLEIHVGAEPSELKALHLTERGAPVEPEARRIDCTLAHIDAKVAEREIKAVCKRLDWPAACAQIHQADESSGPGNILEVEHAFEHVTERVAAHGALGVSSEQVAKRAANAMRNYLDSGVTVGLHLADQLLLPMALAGGGSFTTFSETNHIRTNIQTIRSFVDVAFELEPLESGVQIRISI